MHFKPKIKKKNFGFTLIELLVVIAIIGLISSIVFASLSSARKKARDARRMQDLYQIRTALEMYFNDYRYYPPAPAGTWLVSTDATWSTLQTALAPYMPKLPKDPINNVSGPWTTGNYSYAYARLSSDTSRYDLVAQFENTGNANRCELKCYIYHSQPTLPLDRPWCAPCINNWGSSPYMYADH